MRIALVDLHSADGIVSKDTVAGGYGSRLRPFSRVTKAVSRLKSWLHALPSMQLGYLAAVLAAKRHEVEWSRGPEVPRADLTIVLSSLVDHTHEAAFADRVRASGQRVGFVGLTASKLPDLFLPHADFVIDGEPESAVARLADGERLSGIVKSAEIAALDDLPFPRWDLAPVRRSGVTMPFGARPTGGAFPVMASRSCPEFCTYCPHRIQTSYRTRSVASIVDELKWIVHVAPRPYVVFRDPLFTQDRERIEELCARIVEAKLDVRFECETRLDRLDEALLDRMHAAGLRAASFGVESLSAETLRRSGRRPIPERQQRGMVDHCRRLGVVTAGFYVLGFLQDDWASIAATIDYAIDLGSTVAQFKLLTPYPGTPMWKQLAPLVTESDWERFDGFTPVFRHPNLTPEELRFLLGAAYTRFYMRPSYAANYMRVSSGAIRHAVRWLDTRIEARHARQEIVAMRRAVTC
jgi:radical SAM superfamily enzyme YgiQ (UPF0313 family)